MATIATPQPPTLIDVPPGLKGVAVTETSIGDVLGEAGMYHYRGHDAIELARERTFEDVWQLVLDGSLPAGPEEREGFSAEVRTGRELPTSFDDVLATLARGGSTLDGLRTALSVVATERACRPVVDADPSERRHDAIALAAVTPTLLCALHRLRAGLDPIEPRGDLGHAANLLWMLHGREAPAGHVRAVEQYLIATIDHGFNASTFTARVVASTGADVGACLVAAIGAMSGPLHGGAPSRALDLIDAVGSADRIDEVVGPLIRRGDRIMGFGHPVYRTADPRSVMLAGLAPGLARTREQRRFVELANAVEDGVVRMLAEHKPERRLRANVEFYAGVVMELCGIPREMFTPTFVCGRVVGWGAHVLEQASSARIIRPSARYLGPPPAITPISRP